MGSCLIDATRGGSSRPPFVMCRYTAARMSATALLAALRPGDGIHTLARMLGTKLTWINRASKKRRYKELRRICIIRLDGRRLK